MIFNIVIGKKPTYTVTLYGYPGSTITVDGTTIVNLDGSGVGSIVLEGGNHSFKDGYKTSNTKTISNLSSDTTLVVGFLLEVDNLGSINTPTITGAGSAGPSSTTQNTTVPSGTFTNAYVEGSVTAYQWHSQTMTWVRIDVSGSIKVAGVECAAQDTYLVYTESENVSSRSTGVVTFNGTGNISSSGGTVSVQGIVSATQGSGLDTNGQGYVRVTKAYIY